MIKKGSQFKSTKIGFIPEEWNFEALEKHADVIMGQSPESIFYNNNGDGLPFLQGIRTFGRKYPIYDTYTTKVTKLASQGSVLLSVRAPVGEVNIADKDVCIGRGLAAINSKNNEFIFQLFKVFKEYVVGQETGTVYGSVSKNDIAKLEFPFPRENEQKKISEILSSLDDKIELNRKINDNLEKIASSLFKRWFVDFEFPDKDGKPYKSSGGKMTDSELGEIPDEWEVLGINKITDIEYGRGEYSKISKGKYSVFGAGGFVGYSDNYEHENQQLIVGCRGTCGNISITDKYVTITHNSLIIKPKKDSNFNIYSLKKSLEFSEIKSVITGSTQPQITIKDLSSLLIIKPSKKILDKYNNFIIDFEECILGKKNEIKNLELIRDSLLSKLMSGKIRVKI